MLSDRQGTRVAENKGTLGVDFKAKYSNGCILEAAGLIPYDAYVRGVHLDDVNNSRVETMYHPSLVPRAMSVAFSMEAFVKVTGGEGFHRVVLVNGRQGGFLALETTTWCFVTVKMACTK